MDFERGNRLFAAILIALLVWLVSAIISETLVVPHHLKQSVYKIDVPEGDQKIDTDKPKDALEPIGPLMAEADVEKGKKVFKQCIQCHANGQGAAHKIGPNLWGVVGAAIASKDGFSYSSGARALSSKTWTVEALNEFLYKPRKYISGTKMSFAGLKKAKTRANVIAYLKTLAG